MSEIRRRFYARISSEAQTRDNTIASQVESLEERIAADGFELELDLRHAKPRASDRLCSTAEGKRRQTIPPRRT